MTEMYSGGEEITQVEHTELLVRPVYRVVEMTSPGPQGPAGPPGAPGGSRYVHTQITPVLAWIVNHGLGYEPISSTVIVDGTDVTDGVDIFHVDVNNLTVLFSQPAAGKAAFL